MQKTTCVVLEVPNGQMWIELVKYHLPVDEVGIRQSNGIRHICFKVGREYL